MKIKSIQNVGKKYVYDLSVADVEHYILENGVVTHNTGIIYSADNIWIIGRQQDKNDKTKEIDGYNFVINIEKSRYVKEKSKIPITVNYDGGINKWSGFKELALEGNYIANETSRSIMRVDQETGELIGDKIPSKDIEKNSKFWKSLFEETDISEYIKKKYSLETSGKMIKSDENYE